MDIYERVIGNRLHRLRKPSMYWDLYYETKTSEGLLPYTLDKYHICLVKFEQWLMEQSTIPSKQNVRRFLAHLYDRGLSPFRIRNYWVSLMSFYSWAEESGHITKNPMKGVKPPKLPIRPIEIYKDIEVTQILASTHDTQQYTAITLYWRTGIRPSEILKIKHDDIDIEGQTFYIHGKGAKDRIVPFDDACLSLLRAHLWHNRSVYIFPSSLASIRKNLKTSCRLCSVRYRGIHCFRHTFACNYLMAGGNPLDLKYILGHSSLAMVNHYSQWIESDRAIDNYHRIFSKF